MFSDPDFQVRAPVDKRGRKVSKKAARGEDMRRYYRLRDEGEWQAKARGEAAAEEGKEGEEVGEDEEQRPKGKAGSKKQRAVAPPSSEEEEEEEEEEEDGEGASSGDGLGGDSSSSGDDGSDGEGSEEAEAKLRWARARGLVGERVDQFDQADHPAPPFCLPVRACGALARTSSPARGAPSSLGPCMDHPVAVPLALATPPVPLATCTLQT
jgi:hypothetical protein